jgi:GNAT superfamily N-acetyltransferase
MTNELTIRRMSIQDIPAGLCLCRASGWNQVEEDWRQFLTSNGSAGFLAERDGQVLGSVAIIRHEPVVWIAMMLVHPGHRRQGVATKLMETAIDAAGDVDCIGLDATPAGEPLYRRFGFARDRQFVRMKALIAGDRLPALHSAVRRMQQADIASVLERDREVFGADRSGLLMSLFERAPDGAWIAGDSSLLGYVFGRPGYRYHQIGPLVAEDSVAARLVLEACCCALRGREAVIDVQCSDPEWTRSLGSLGFVEERPFARMFRQPAIHPGRPAEQFAIAGPEFA